MECIAKMKVEEFQNAPKINKKRIENEMKHLTEKNNKKIIKNEAKMNQK